MVSGKEKEGTLYLPPTSLELSFSLPSTANPDRGLRLYPLSRKGDPPYIPEQNPPALLQTIKKP